MYAASHPTYNAGAPKLCIRTEVDLVHKPETGSGSHLADPGPQKRRHGVAIGAAAVEATGEEMPSKRRQLGGEEGAAASGEREECEGESSFLN